MLQLRNTTALVKDVSDKATQNVPLEEKEDIGEEVVEGKKEEKEEMNEEEDKIDIKNVSQALPLRRSARAARRAIVKVDQVRLFPCRPPFLHLLSLLSPIFLPKVSHLSALTGALCAILRHLI